jgi:hypothetical protein
MFDLYHPWLIRKAGSTSNAPGRSTLPIDAAGPLTLPRPRAGLFSDAIQTGAKETDSTARLLTVAVSEYA